MTQTSNVSRLPGILYVVATPIGHLGDVSVRAAEVLLEADVIVAEDTRHTRRLLNHLGVASPRLIALHEHNEVRQLSRVIHMLASGQQVALVSDAGTPLISDPGYRLVDRATSEELRVVAVPGPSAVTAALSVSGLPTDRFVFEGFLPKKQSDRKRILLEINNNEKTTILFESPQRLIKLLRELKEFCGGEREIQVSREITKKFEEHIGNNINEVLEFFEGKKIIGEITIVIKGINKTKKTNFDESLIKKELYALINAGLSLPAASKYLAKKENLTRKIIYNLY